MKKIFALIFFSLKLFALDFKVASYNVENLFDLHNNKTEYKEYKPYSKYWNKNALKNKLNNISEVILDLNAHIVGLQEIESKEVLELLLEKLPSYKYSYFLKNKNSAIGIAIISKFKIIKNEKIVIDNYNKYSRPILKSTIKINNNKLIIYTNHWKSKRSMESTRIPYAQSLKKDINKLKADVDYIILGDLNSNYNEYITFQNDKKLNDTYGVTGINQVLNTSYNGNLIHKNILISKDGLLYNLWLDLSKYNRFSSIYRGIKNTPDNIILPKSLFDNKNISYINNSFNVYKKSYVYTNKILRWNLKKQIGYSDHLPIFASFSTSKQKYNFSKFISLNSINDLYKIQKLSNSISLNNLIVIYKTKNKAIIKAKNSKAILIYKKNHNLKLAHKYNLKINKIKDYNGLLEIVDFDILKAYKNIYKYKKLYYLKDEIDIFKLKNQNEIIKNIVGIYKKKYLYFDNKKIYLYFNKKVNKPKNNSKIKIINAHIGIYKTKIQLNINKQSDFKAIY